MFKNMLRIITPRIAKNKPNISPFGAENLTLVIITQNVTPPKTMPVSINAAGTISGATTLAIKRTGARIKPDIKPSPMSARVPSTGFDLHDIAI